MSALKEWWTCRIYDPAIDFSQKLDEDGELVWKDGLEEGTRVAVLVSDTDRFMETRDPADLVFKPDEEPAKFWLRPLAQSQLREYVNRATAHEERYMRAFECALVRIENWRSPEGHIEQLSVERKRDGIEKVKPESMDRLFEHGLKQLDAWEIGFAAWVRASIPFGCGAQLQAPRWSITAAAVQRQHCLSVAAKSPDSPSSDEAREPPPNASPPPT